MSCFNRSFRLAGAVALVVGAWLASPGDASAQGVNPPLSHPELFYNYYVPANPAGGVGAQLYISPRPTPPLVGHTYITYQALMPHEFLYKHHRHYYRYHPGSGYTKTRVRWW
jgi:hypothetical protein